MVQAGKEVEISTKGIKQRKEEKNKNT